MRNNIVRSNYVAIILLWGESTRKPISEIWREFAEQNFQNETEFRCNYGNDFAQKMARAKRARKEKACARDQPGMTMGR